MTDTEGCCDLHGRSCEPPSELCCHHCTEAAHPDHADGSACSAPDLSRAREMPPTKPARDEFEDRLAWALVGIENNYRRETSNYGSRFEGERLEVVQARYAIRETRRQVATQLRADAAALRRRARDERTRDWVTAGRTLAAATALEERANEWSQP